MYSAASSLRTTPRQIRAITGTCSLNCLFAGALLVDHEQHLAESVRRLEALVRVRGFGEREDAVDHGTPRRFGTVREERVELAGTAERRAMKPQVAKEEVGDRDAAELAAGVAEGHEDTAGSQCRYSASPDVASDGIDHGIHWIESVWPARVAVAGTVLGAEPARQLELLAARCRHEHSRTERGADLYGEGCDAASCSGDQHSLARPGSGAGHEGTPGCQPGDRERRRVQPRPPRRARTYLLGLDDELIGVAPLAQDADEHEAISGGGFVVAPADAGVDDDFVSD